MAKNTICLIGLVLFCHGCSFFWEPHKGIACSASEHCPSEGYRCYLGKCRQNTEKRCGDLVVEGVEECDDGANNSDTLADACRTTCIEPACGDGVKDDGEACDGGAGNSEDPDALCRTDCMLAGCGDGVEDDGEACDAGTDNSDTLADACRPTCIEPACGDGVEDDGEECDAGVDGTPTDSASCDSDCTAVVCGDGHINTVDNETCDAGVDGIPTDSASCDSDCTAVVCGDGHRNTVSEECDDGNTTAGDGCDAECQNVFTLSTNNKQDLFVAQYDSAGVIQWAKHFGGPDKDLIHDIVALSDGAFYLAGDFCRGNSDPCTATFGTEELTSQEDLDAFVARYSASGELQWIRQIGGQSDQSIFSLALGAEDSIYILGSACRSAEGCATEIQAESEAQRKILSGAGSSDIFWVHYDQDGNDIEHESLAGTGEESARGLSVTGAGDANVFVGGSVSANPDAYLEDADLFIGGQADLFVKEVKGDTWETSYIMLGSFFDDDLKALWVDDEHMVLSGSFCQGSNPGCAFLFNAQTVATNQGDDDGFIFWLNRNKELQSVYRVGSAAKDEIVALASEDGQSMVSLASFCAGEATECIATIGNADGESNQQMSGVGYKDIALIKSTSAGEAERIKHLASAGTDRPGDMTLLSESALAVVGSFDCTNSGCFGVRDSEGNISAGEPSIQSTGDKDIFVAVFNVDGSIKWLLSAGSGMDDFASSVAPLADGGMLVAGHFCASEDDLESCTATFD